MNIIISCIPRNFTGRLILVEDDNSDSKYVASNVDDYELPNQDLLTNLSKIYIPTSEGDARGVTRRHSNSSNSDSDSDSLEQKKQGYYQELSDL